MAFLDWTKFFSPAKPAEEIPENETDYPEVPEPPEFKPEIQEAPAPEPEHVLDEFPEAGQPKNKEAAPLDLSRYRDDLIDLALESSSDFTRGLAEKLIAEFGGDKAKGNTAMLFILIFADMVVNGPNGCLLTGDFKAYAKSPTCSLTDDDKPGCAIKLFYEYGSAMSMRLADRFKKTYFEAFKPAWIICTSFEPEEREALLASFDFPWEGRGKALLKEAE